MIQFNQLNRLCCPALVFLVAAILVCCAVIMAGRAADNADEIEKNLQGE